MAALQNESEDNFLEVEKIIQIRFNGSFTQFKTEEINTKTVKAIEDCPGLTTLHLEVFLVDIAAPKAIGRVLERHSSLKKVLWIDLFNYTDRTVIPRALSYLCKGIITACANIVVLNLSKNKLDSSGITGLKDFFESPCCYTLEELNLSYNFLGIEGAELLSEYMCKCIENSLKNGTPMKLKVFECSNNLLGNDGVTFVSKFLDGLSSLESIDLTNNDMGPTGMRALSNVFYSNPSLKKITLDFNNLSEDGVNHLVCSLPSLQELETLSLRYCHLRGFDVRRLGIAMEDSCPKVRTIDLSCNEIDSGVDVLLDSMENKAFFEDLNINFNNFSPEVEESLLYRIFAIKREMGKVDLSREDNPDMTDASDGKESTGDEE